MTFLHIRSVNINHRITYNSVCFNWIFDFTFLRFECVYNSSDAVGNGKSNLNAFIFIFSYFAFANTRRFECTKSHIWLCLLKVHLTTLVWVADLSRGDTRPLVFLRELVFSGSIVRWMKQLARQELHGPRLNHSLCKRIEKFWCCYTKTIVIVAITRNKMSGTPLVNNALNTLIMKIMNSNLKITVEVSPTILTHLMF